MSALLELADTAWRCKRCGEDVDYDAMRCGCDIGPSPWEPKPTASPTPDIDAALAGLVEVLRPFADVAAFLDAPDDTYAEWPDHYGLGEVEAGQLPVTIGDFREARAALDRLTSQPPPTGSKQPTS